MSKPNAGRPVAEYILRPSVPFEEEYRPPLLKWFIQDCAPCAAWVWKASNGGRIGVAVCFHYTLKRNQHPLAEPFEPLWSSGTAGWFDTEPEAWEECVKRKRDAMEQEEENLDFAMQELKRTRAELLEVELKWQNSKQEERNRERKTPEGVAGDPAA